jgi:hypothetical protein
MQIKIPKIKLPDKIMSNVFESKKNVGRAARVEKRHLSIVTLYCLLAIVVICVFITLLLHFFGGGVGSWVTHISNAMDNLIAAAIVLIFLDTIVMMNNENRRQRDERRAILRHNKIIQPTIDMYIVRKNMVITPNEKTVRKFQINATFTVKDMKDMYGPSELISDVGRSKIEMYQFYQNKLAENMTHLVESVEFTFYQGLCDAAMKYINATSYGASALEAVVGYQSSMAGTRSMRSMVLSQIREEPENGRFTDASPMMKNVYLVHQMINDQEIALSEYLRIVQSIIEEEPKDRSKVQTSYE